MVINRHHAARRNATPQRIFPRTRSGLFFLSAVVSLLLGAAWGTSAEDAPKIDLTKLPPPAAGPVDFIRDVQPILQQNCYRCHGPEKQKSGLRLDHRSGALHGGDGGPAIVPGKSAESRMIQYVAGLVEDMVMPPPKSGATRLSPTQVGLLRAWIDQGARWPVTELAESSKSDFWVFRAATPPAVPCPKNPGWARNEVDRFILDRLEREGLSPAPEADRRTLIRRVSFDLTGLPPTPEEVQSFLADQETDAYERMVDRLLASPRYGERWARHWLDIVHYGETHGYDKDKPRLTAWPYRDYVIRSFNQDKRYARFVAEQIAGDVLFPEDPDGVVATGFLAAGPWDFVGHVELPESKTDGLIARYNDRDDMVMTTMSTFQSLTVHCARCHDHKFDPISQEDYYSLQAVFAGIDRAERSFDPDPAVFGKRKRLQAEIDRATARKRELEAAVLKTSPRILSLADARIQELSKEQAALAKAAATPDSPSNGYHSGIASTPDTLKWVQVDLGAEIPIDQIRLIPARPTDFPDSPGFGFPTRFRVEVASDTNFEKPILLLDHTGKDFQNPGDEPVAIPAEGKMARAVRVTATRLWERTSDYVFALAELQVMSRGQNAALGKTVTALDSIESGRWAKAFLADGFGSRKRLDPAGGSTAATGIERRAALANELEQLQAERKQLLDRVVAAPVRAELEQTEARLDELKQALAALPRPQKVFAAAHDFEATGSFHPAKEPRPVAVLRRGDVKQPIHLAVPGALSCLPGLPSRFALENPADEGSRRAALAKWIIAPENLLTRRSIVNRIWQEHFGRGLVDTPNDFGHMGSRPSHPELLDWLAFWFAAHGESMKALHRLLLTSATYRQAVTSNPESAKVDADNRLLWRMNRSRLDAESLHDSILYVAGRLDLTEGGPSVQQFFFKDDHSPVYDYTRFDVDRPEARRRSVYRFIVRSVPDPWMESLDCPDASLLAPKREATVTALQALSLWNDPFVLRQCAACAQRLGQASPDPGTEVELLCQLAWSRPPKAGERAELMAYTREHGLANLCRVILNSSEFMFVE